VTSIGLRVEREASLPRKLFDSNSETLADFSMALVSFFWVTDLRFEVEKVPVSARASIRTDGGFG
jgi:hypothetical protein